MNNNNKKIKKYIYRYASISLKENLIVRLDSVTFFQRRQFWRTFYFATAQVNALSLSFARFLQCKFIPFLSAFQLTMFGGWRTFTWLIFTMNQIPLKISALIINGNGMILSSAFNNILFTVNEFVWTLSGLDTLLFL